MNVDAMPQATDTKLQAPKAILLVGADATHRESVALACRMNRFGLIDASAAADACATFEETRVDLVLLDLATAGRGVLAACSQLRALKTGKYTPIVLLADGKDIEMIRCGCRAGASDFVALPIDGVLLSERMLCAMRAAEATKLLHHSASRLSQVQRIGRLGSWSKGLESDSFECDIELLRIFDVDGSRSVALLQDLLLRVHPDDRRSVEVAMAQKRPHRLGYRVVVERPGFPDTTRFVRQESWLTQDDVDGKVRLIGTVLDVTELREVQERAAQLAYVDSLTGLPNRAHLRAYLDRALSDARRTKRPCGVLALGLDFFKRINDTLGHPAGDELLNVAAQRVARSVRGSDPFARTRADATDRSLQAADATVARLGGDEFVVILPDLRDPEDAAVAARRLIRDLGEPVDLSGTTVFPSCSVGIAIHPENGDTSESLLEHADAALNHAKDLGRGTFHFFNDDLTEREKRRMDLEMGLRLALKEGALVVHYQPKLNLLTQQVTGVEALVRWKGADGKFIPPDQFIPIAEDSGLIVELGRFVLRTACLQAKAWVRSLSGDFSMAVNVSARQLWDPAFESVVTTILEETGLDPRLLELEITEGAVMKDATASAALLQKFTSRGIRIAVDDFGTGHSSLAYLARFPVDTLKIDRSFVNGVGSTRTASESIVVAIVALSKALSLRVVAEGIETTEQSIYLASSGCDLGQGYLFGRPMAADQLEAWFHEHVARVNAAS